MTSHLTVTDLERLTELVRQLDKAIRHEPVETLYERAAEWLLARGVRVGEPAQALDDLMTDTETTLREAAQALIRWANSPVYMNVDSPSAKTAALRGEPTDAQITAARDAWPADYPLPADAELAAIVRAVNRCPWPAAPKESP